MNHRPYPSIDRALKQLDRHYPDPPAVGAPEVLSPLVDSFARLRENTRRAVGQGLGAGTYVLSTRRPSIVGGQP